MPRDACDMLRNFDQIVAEAIVSRDDLGDLIQECIGELAEEDRSWVPMCPEYPNLKGVTCEDIGDFVDLFPTEEEQKTLSSESNRCKPVSFWDVTIYPCHYDKSYISDYLRHVKIYSRRKNSKRLERYI